ncbi:DNA topoisomerase (ATP-hydrolyzing) subunit B [Desulfothermus okinawensis JCM 13304]
MNINNPGFNNDYTAASITILEGLSAVRKRPAMYIGSQDINGVHHLIYEVVDNSIDEAMAGYCDKIKIVIHIDNSITVKDNGRGIPVDIHPKEGRPAVEVVMTVLHAGGKFDNHTYKVSGGLHGVGISVVNALSEFLEVTIKRDGKRYYQKYSRGKPLCDLVCMGESSDRGTTIHFRPDEEIFESIYVNYDVLKKRFEELAYLNKGLEITFIDERYSYKDVFKFDGGIYSFVENINQSYNTLHSIIYNKKEVNNVIVEFAMQYTDDYKSKLYSFANNIRTKDGGTHLAGFKAAVTKSINSYLKNSDIPKKLKVKERIQGEDILEGLTAVISVKLPNPQFEGQTKTKLGNSEVAGYVQSVVNETLGQFFEENPKEVLNILEKVIETARAREAAKRAKDLVKRKNLLSDTFLPGKLTDCQSKNPEESELFIVEGDSAGGSAKQGRDPKYQAILPLRGKILNVEKTRFDKMLKNREIQSLITALGVGIGDEEIDISKLRYHKIIIMTDADVDGAHIRTLLLTFFYRNYRELIENGFLYIAQPPLYRVHRGKVEKFINNEKELREFFVLSMVDDIEVTCDGKKIEKKDIIFIVNKLNELEDKINDILNFGLPYDLVLNLLTYNDNLKTIFSVSSDEEVYYLKQSDDFRKISEYLETREYKLDIYTTEMDDLKRYYLKFIDINNHEFLLGMEFFNSKLYKSSYEVIQVLKNLSKDLSFNIKFKDGREEVDLILFDLVKSILNEANKHYNIQRYKGLGEMNPDQLWETTMNREKRQLLQVTINEAEEANELFSKLMGDKVEPRREFIEKNALSVDNLDI